jgi:hypothetical protein
MKNPGPDGLVGLQFVDTAREMTRRSISVAGQAFGQFTA